MERIVLNALLAAVIGLSAAGTAAAQANHNTARSNKSTVTAPTGGEDQKTAAHEAAHVVQQRGGFGGSRAHDGDHAASLGANNNGDAQESQKREKMKKLEHDEVYLELMDETDTCPTLPCSAP